MLVLAKKGTTSPTSLTYDQALEEAICFGWIDGQVRRRDERTYLQRFTPRRSRSRWSKRNTTLAERLISEGRMRASGVAEVERAKADGRWEAAYAGPATARVPDDLAAALAAEPKAMTMFRRLTSDAESLRDSASHRGGEAARDSCPQDRGVRGEDRKSVV